MWTEERVHRGDVLAVWRGGESVTGTPAENSAVARAWVEDLVRSHGLFPWRGIAPAPRGTKPRLLGDPNADFSISHSGTQVVVGVAVGARIGVDVEQRPFHAFDSANLRRRMCSPAEFGRAEALDGEPRREYLARVWTAKEAVAKASGHGLALDFRRLEVDLPHARRVDGRRQEAHVALLGCGSAPVLIRAGA